MRLNSSKKFLESTTVQVLTITLCVFAIVALLLRLRLHQTMLSVVTTSYASIDETRAHIEGQIAMICNCWNVIVVAVITGRIVAHGLISISHTSARMTFTMNLCCQCQLVLYLLMMRWECCFE